MFVQQQPGKFKLPLDGVLFKSLLEVKLNVFHENGLQSGDEPTDRYTTTILCCEAIKMAPYCCFNVAQRAANCSKAGKQKRQHSRQEFLFGLTATL